jgi:cytochrome P450
VSDDVFSALTTEAARLDPYPVYAAYRTGRRLVDTGMGVWFVFGHEDCLALLRERRTSVDERNSLIGAGQEEDRLRTLIHLDPPDHDRLRRLVQVAFTPRRVEALRERAEAIVAATVSGWRAGEEHDLISELAYPMPLAIICDLLGVEANDRDAIQEWSAWLARSIDPDFLRSPELNAEIERQQDTFVTFVRDLIARRRAQPGDDLLSQLVEAELQGDRLDEDELVGLAVLLLVAGHETTVSLIGNGMRALLLDPTQLALAASGQVATRELVDELLRFDPPVQMTTRTMLDDVDLPGGTIPRGHVAVLLLGSANRDGAVFANADRLDVTAIRPTAHLAFGNGIHHCLGAALARAEAAVAIDALVRSFPTMTLVADAPLCPTFVLRRRTELRVRL